MGQRPPPWPAVQGPVSAQLGSDLDRGHREVSRLRHDPRHRPGLRQEARPIVRVRAGISYALTQAMDEGHCGLPHDELVPLAAALLEAPPELVKTALELELVERAVIADTVGEKACIFLTGLYRAEQVIADRLRRLARGVLPWPEIDPEKALPWIEGKTGLSLAQSQAAAIRLALKSKVLVITGGPGVGKTTIVNAILRILSAKGVGLLLCAS